MVLCCPFCPNLLSCEFIAEDISAGALYTSELFTKQTVDILKENKNKQVDSNALLNNKSNIIVEPERYANTIYIINNYGDTMNTSNSGNTGNNSRNTDNKGIIGNNSKIDHANISSPYANVTDIQNIAGHIEELKNLIKVNEFKNKQEILEEVESFSKDVNKPNSNSKTLIQAFKYISLLIGKIPEIAKDAGPIIKTIFDALDNLKLFK